MLLLDHFFASLLAEIQQLEGILDDVLFDFVIEGGVGGEGRRLVDFDEPGPEVLVDHDVEAEDLEAHRVIVVVRLARAVDVSHVWLPNDDRFDDDVLDALHDEVWVGTLLHQDLHHGVEGPLVAALFL